MSRFITAAILAGGLLLSTGASNAHAWPRWGYGGYVYAPQSYYFGYGYGVPAYGYGYGYGAPAYGYGYAPQAFGVPNYSSYWPASAYSYTYPTVPTYSYGFTYPQYYYGW